MALQLNISKEFLDLSNSMIEALKNKSVVMENCNIAILKVPLINPSPIETAEDFKKREAYKSGVGRVLAIPRLTNHETDPARKGGDYIVYSHEARSSVYLPVVNLIFGMTLDFEEGKDPVIF